MKIYFECEVCKTEFFRYYNNTDPKLPKHNFCSRKCKNEWQSENLVGDNNPNFNNKWTDTERLEQAELIKSKINDEFREKAGSANRGKKFSVDRIKRMHEHRDSSSYSRPHTEESKKLIGEKSSQKFLDHEYLKKVRATMEERGHWIPLSEKEAYKIYVDASDWITNMYECLAEEELTDVNFVGMFHSVNNSKGYVRDHVYSRKDGFLNGVFVEILRHPCNCCFIRHGLNSSKKDSSWISLEELFERIEAYSGKWAEHKIALEMVRKYKNGDRWTKELYLQEVYSGQCVFGI